jgi:hypothetical protein
VTADQDQKEAEHAAESGTHAHRGLERLWPTDELMQATEHGEEAKEQQDDDYEADGQQRHEQHEVRQPPDGPGQVMPGDHLE